MEISPMSPIHTRSAAGRFLTVAIGLVVLASLDRHRARSQPPRRVPASRQDSPSRNGRGDGLKLRHFGRRPSGGSARTN